MYACLTPACRPGSVTVPVTVVVSVVVAFAVLVIPSLCLFRIPFCIMSGDNVHRGLQGIASDESKAATVFAKVHEGFMNVKTEADASATASAAAEEKRLKRKRMRDEAVHFILQADMNKRQTEEEEKDNNDDLAEFVVWKELLKTKMQQDFDVEGHKAIEKLRQAYWQEYARAKELWWKTKKSNRWWRVAQAFAVEEDAEKRKHAVAAINSCDDDVESLMGEK